MKRALSYEGGLELSSIVAGVMHWGIWGADYSPTEVARLIESCVDLGVTSFDHADIYGNYTTEALWGKAIKNVSINRADIQLITKCGICYPKTEDQVKSYHTSKDYIIKSVEQSLRNLSTDYIDLLLIHRPSPLMMAEEIAEAVLLLKSSGKILEFGVSNFTPSQMDLIHVASPIATNQVEASLLHFDPYLDGTFDYCQKKNIHPMIWSPLGGGKLFENSGNFDFVNQRARILEVCKKYDWTLEEAAYLFLLHHPFYMFPVTGSSKIERIQIAVDCLGKEISDEQWFELWTASVGRKVP
jgi:predicted oxidoreductase